jgi:hypothetical protein
LATYAAGYLARYQGGAEVYNLAFQRSIEELASHQTPLARFYPYLHPPVLLGFLKWLTNKNYSASYLRWIALLGIFHFVSVLILVRLLAASGWPRARQLLFGLSALLFYPAIIAYLQGQDSAFLLLGVSLWTGAVLGGQDAVAGLGLALTLIRPQVTMVLAPPFLVKKRRVFWWFLAFSVGVSVYCLVAVGFQGMESYLRMLIINGSGYSSDIDIMATFLRAFPGITPQMLNWIGYGTLALAVIALGVIWRTSSQIGCRQIGLAVLASIFFSPHIHNHDWMILLIPAVCLMLILQKDQILSAQEALAIPVLLTFFIIVSDLLDWIWIVYLIFLGLGILLCYPTWIRPVVKLRRGESS